MAEAELGLELDLLEMLDDLDPDLTLDLFEFLETFDDLLKDLDLFESLEILEDLLKDLDLFEILEKLEMLEDLDLLEPDELDLQVRGGVKAGLKTLGLAEGGLPWLKDSSPKSPSAGLTGGLLGQTGDLEPDLQVRGGDKAGLPWHSPSKSLLAGLTWGLTSGVPTMLLWQTS